MALWWVSGGTALFLFFALMIPSNQSLFRFASLHTIDLILGLGAGALSILISESLKTRLSRQQAKDGVRPQQRHAIATLVIIDPHERSTVSWKEPVLEYSEEHRLIRLSSPSDGFSELFNEEYQWSHAVEEYPITQRQRSSIEQWLKE